MKNMFSLLLLGLAVFQAQTFSAHAMAENKSRPVNYTIVLDLSDRVLTEDQLQKDFALIRKMFQEFKTKARRGLILTSKDRFAVKIIPQKGSSLDHAYFEDRLQLKLDEVSVQLKNKRMLAFAEAFEGTLKALESQARLGKTSSEFFGVDIWAYLNDNAESFSKDGYRNLVLLATDGYFDFEKRSHVLQSENRFTSTYFLKELSGFDWKEKAEKENYGLIPIRLKSNIEWVISGISSKNEQDILQNKKIIYIWEKWLRESGAQKFHFILNTSGSQMTSKLLVVL